VVVAHEGERMLSAKTGDAQAFARLEQSGAWAEIRKGRGTYAMGGIVGGVSSGASRKMSSGTSNSTISVQVYGATDVDSFKRSEAQIGAKIAEQVNKGTRRKI
jgi:hypothetical protein